MGKIIAVASGKGGVGKTTLSSALGIQFASLGKKTLVIDGDVGLRNIDIHLSVFNDVVYDLWDVLLGRCELEKAALRCPQSPHLYCLASPQAVLPSEVPENIFSDLCKKAADIFEIIIIDCPAGIGKLFFDAVKAADTVLVVTTPDNASIRDGQRIAQLTRGFKRKRVRLVINRVNPLMIKKHYASNIDEIIDNVSVQLIGLIPESPAFQKLANGNLKQLKAKSPEQISIHDIALRLTGKQKPLYKFW